MYTYSCVLECRIDNKGLVEVVSRKLNRWKKQWYHMFLWFLVSKFGVWLVVPMKEHSAPTFVNTSHAFSRFLTISTNFLWGVSLNFKGYRRSRDTGSDLDRRVIQRTSVRRLMEPAIYIYVYIYIYNIFSKTKGSANTGLQRHTWSAHHYPTMNKGFIKWAIERRLHSMRTLIWFGDHCHHSNQHNGSASDEEVL